MILKVNKIEYETIVASDVKRDGLGIELWDKNRNEILFEIFRHDDEKKLTFYCSKQELPLEVVEKLIEDFDNRVGREFM